MRDIATLATLTADNLRNLAIDFEHNWTDRVQAICELHRRAQANEALRLAAGNLVVNAREIEWTTLDGPFRVQHKAFEVTTKDLIALREALSAAPVPAAAHPTAAARVDRCESCGSTARLMLSGDDVTLCRPCVDELAEQP